MWGKLAAIRKDQANKYKSVRTASVYELLYDIGRLFFMNRNYILYNLKEAQEELRRAIAEIESAHEYEYGDFLVPMSHLYHHINTAWNARDSSQAESDQCSEENFNKWRTMPTSLELLLVE
jgi:hypothetical protein